MDVVERFSMEWVLTVDPSLIERTRLKRVVAGVDEAGRGCVLGPMVYGIACVLEEDERELALMGCRDSKTMTPKRRSQVAQTLLQSDRVLCGTLSVGAEALSEAMRTGINLNNLSHMMIMAMLERVQRIVPLATVVCDMVGPVETMAGKLKTVLAREVELLVTPMADSAFPSVSAASILAKTERDRAIDELRATTDCGSGYSSDAKTVRWLRDQLALMRETRDLSMQKHIRTEWATWKNMQ